jgi:hypothetical protein
MPTRHPDTTPQVRDPELRTMLERMERLIVARVDPTAPVQAPIPPPRLPGFPATARPVVNDMARSALFACIQGKDRQLLNKALLATVEGVEIRFTGRQWNQDDHNLLLQIVHLAGQTPLGEEILVSAYALLRALGRGTSGRHYQELRDDIERLVAGTVSLRSTTRLMGYIGHLVEKAVLDERSQHWLIRLNPDLLALYGPTTYTLIDWEQRKRLRGKDLARWLQLYLATHAAPFPVQVATLKDLSGSRATALRTFRQALRRALTDLQAIGDIVAWDIDAADLVQVERGAVTRSQSRHLARKDGPKR